MNISCKQVKLHNLSPFHLSKGGADFDTSEKILHSDTFKSALFVANLQLYGEDAFAKRFWDSFHLSSAYPYLTYGDQTEYFFPKPKVRLPIEIEGLLGENKLNKKLKNIEYLGKTLFENVLAGRHSMLNEFQLFQKGIFASQTLQQSTEGKEVKVYKTDLQQRVRLKTSDLDLPLEISTDHGQILIDHTSETDTFYVERYFFPKDAGLYVLFHELQDHDIPRLETLLRYLGDSGIGKNTQVGMGHFEIGSIEDFQLDIPNSANHWINLGLYCPQRIELADKKGENVLEKSSYSLVKRGGWITSNHTEQQEVYRKQSVYMFEEGSVFDFGASASQLTVKGKRENLAPKVVFDEHEVWREGRTLFLPIVPVI